ncbi:hypothetical protein Adt_42398 [Abeliophyllum distichum]|uniref:Uncharacterized protein n=1 Tax=Abeliophyllum distichum TaxID=126358 RepID=A0ABD1PRK3_9LAMI
MGPWLVGRDFNMIAHNGENTGRNTHDRDISDFTVMMMDCGLTDARYSRTSVGSSLACRPVRLGIIPRLVFNEEYLQLNRTPTLTEIIKPSKAILKKLEGIFASSFGTLETMHTDYIGRDGKTFVFLLRRVDLGFRRLQDVVDIFSAIIMGSVFTEYVLSGYIPVTSYYSL